MLNEPQNLAEIKTPQLLKILNQRIKNLRQRKLKHNLLKLRENKQEKYAKKMSTSETLQLANNKFEEDKAVNFYEAPLILHWVI